MNMNRSEIELKEMGKIAASKYLNDGVSMDSTIAEMTKEAGLNPHQLARVCENANITTYNSLWEKTGSGDFTFDLANQEKIAETINSTPSIVLQEADSSFESIKDLLPGVEDVDTVKSAEKTSKIAQINELIEKEDTTVSKNEIRKALHKLAFFRDELDMAIAESEMNIYNSTAHITKTVKEAALRGEDIIPLYIVARANYPDKEDKVKSLFTKVATDLKKYNISFKEAGQKYTEDSLGNLNKAVVNKKHPILKHLDTVIREEDKNIDSCKRTKEYIVRKIELLTDKLLSRKYDDGATI